MPIQHHGNHTTPKESSPTPSSLSIAAIYARVSTTDQADKGYSLSTQIEACQELAQGEGYVVPEDYVFVDDYTGTSLNRPQLTRMRDVARQHLVHAIIVHDLDRLSRKLAHQLLLSEEFEQAGILLRVVTMPEGEKTPETQLLSNVRGIIAEYERAKLMERTTRGRLGRVKAGHVPGGLYAFGYRYVKHVDKGAHYEPDPDEAPLVQRIFHLYVDNGLSQYAIAVLLTAEGAPLPSVRRATIVRTLTVPVWHPGTISNILRNTAYTGTLHYGKWRRVPGKQNADKKTRHEATEPESWVAIPVPALISSELFAATQNRLEMNARESRRNRKYDYLLTGGRLSCGQCGSNMCGKWPKGRQPRYYCNRSGRKDIAFLAPHTNRSVLTSTIDPLVWQAVERVLSNPELIAAEVARQKDDTSTLHTLIAQERQQYDRQVTQCDKDLKRWEAAYVGEVITLDDFKAKKAEIDARRASAAEEIARLDAQQAALTQQELEITSLVEYCARVRDSLCTLGIEEKRLALRALNITVIWYPEKPLQIQGSIPVHIASSALS